MNLVVAFDCDGTLIHGDATRRFLLLLRGPLGLLADCCRLAPQLLAWQLGRCSTAALKESLLNQALQAAPMHRRQAALRQLPAILVAQLRPQAKVRLRWHQQQGHRCLIVTASPEPLIAPLAHTLGVELIGTGCSDLLQVGPSSPLRLTTPNCKGAEKVRRLEQHLGVHPHQISWRLTAIAGEIANSCRPALVRIGAASPTRRCLIPNPRLRAGCFPCWPWLCSLPGSAAFCSRPLRQGLTW